MNITYGADKNLFLQLPVKPLKLGVLISGGIDSALLYFLILLENKIQGNLHTVVPLTMLRKEGSRHFAKIVVAYIQSYFKIPYTEPIMVGDNTLPEEQQVKSAVIQAHEQICDIVYAGVIQQLPQHMVDWQPVPSRETLRFRTPLIQLDKSHIVELCARFGLESLYSITHSCSFLEMGRCNQCNGCNERTWGFAQAGVIDTGTL
jgi:diphthamide synthase (EF-2-diphthine--ammonia ligase)